MKKKQKSRMAAEAAARSLETPRIVRPGCRIVQVYVEGYEDVAFWRGILDDYESEKIRFEISVPPREDLAKGKKVILQMVPDSSPDLLLCVDSDFDYLFNGSTEQSRLINESPYVFHTYAYATENYLCYPPSLHKVCVKATKNDTDIFDFERFMAEYSQIIYPLFLWFAFSALKHSEWTFTLIDFRSSVKLNYLDLENNGENTLAWLRRQVDKRLSHLSGANESWIREISEFASTLHDKGVRPDNVYLFMQGHTLMDNVVIVMLHAVCERLRQMTNDKIAASSRRGVVMRNELSNYNNTLRNVREILLDNENYKECFLYRKLKEDFEHYLSRIGIFPSAR
ncbi:MAG: DUF4435 domain-containing protein [Rikenellaceae bacterium]|nr:DUF4435 domain-containing protein [Rikenellaceae bacterium]